MSIVLEIFDQRAGAERRLRHTVDLDGPRVTGRDLLARRIAADVAAFNDAERARAAEEVCDPRDRWLVTPGLMEQSLNGPRGAYGPRPGHVLPAGASRIDPEAQIAAAIEAFARNRFFMIFDGRQILDLDAPLDVARDSTLIFLKLTPLVGG